MKKDEMIGVKVSSETKRKLLEKAKKKEWTLSHYCRKLLEMDAEGYEDINQLNKEEKIKT